MKTSSMSGISESSLIACDVGLKRIGLAHVIGGIVLPLTPILRKNRNQAARDLSVLLAHRGATHLIIGLPSGGVAEHEEMRRRIEHFISLLDFGGERVYVNEDYSSLEALERVGHLGREERAKAQKDGRLDSLSACVILERYLTNLGES